MRAYNRCVPCGGAHEETPERSDWALALKVQIVVIDKCLLLQQFPHFSQQYRYLVAFHSVELFPFFFHPFQPHLVTKMS